MGRGLRAYKDIKEQSKAGHDNVCLVRIRGNTTTVTCNRSYPDTSSRTVSEGDMRGLDVISKGVMSSEPAAP